MKKIIMVGSLVFIFVSMLSSPVFAEQGAFSLSLAGQYIPFISGDAGQGDDAPEYDDAFDAGLGVALEAAYRMTPNFSVVAGVSYDQFSGDDYKDISFDDMDVTTFYVGGKYYFLIDKKGWSSYLRGDIGTAYFSSVDISYSGVDAEYWQSSWGVVGDAGVGVEYDFDNMGVFLEIKARYMDSPSKAKEMREYSDADASWSVPITLGVSYHF